MGWSRVALGGILFAILLVTLVFLWPLRPSTIKLNQKYHRDSLGPYLANEVASLTGRMVAIDAAEKTIVDKLKQKGAERVATHHSYSYIKPTGFVSGSPLEPLYNFSISRPWAVDVAATQTATLQEQVGMGVRGLDIRVSRVDGTMVVDHGTIFGTLKAFVDDLRGAAGDTTGIQLMYNVSAHNSDETLTPDDITAELKRLGVPDTVEMKYTPHGRLAYEQTKDPDKVNKLLQGQGDAVLVVTTNRSEITVQMVLVVILALILTLAIVLGLPRLAKRDQNEAATPFLLKPVTSSSSSPPS